MYAIVETGGKQFRMAEGERIRVPRLAVEGDSVTLDRVLLLAGEGSVEIGKPTVTGARVRCKVLGEARTQKLIVYKYKRRKDYKRTYGSRTWYTRLLVEKIEKA